MKSGTENKKKKRTKIGKPPKFIYWCAFGIMSIIYKIKYHITIDRSGVEDLKGPSLILAPHVSNHDHILTGLALFPERPTYVLSEHFMAIKPLRPILKMMHVISKKMFCPDTVSVLNIVRAVKEGNSVLLFPEGRLTWYGRSLRIADGTADLVKMLKVNVYTVTSNGAGMIFPKWAKCKRSGRIEIKTEKILTPDEIKNLSVNEIKEIIDNKIYHDSEKALPDCEVKSKDLSLGADGIIWKCPLCQKEDGITAHDGRIFCTCGLEATLDGHSNLVFNKEITNNIKTLSDWYEYCADSIDIASPLSRRCTLSAMDEEGYMVKNVGEGEITITKDTFTYKGTAFGKDGSFDVSTSVMKAFPVSIGDHIDAYNGTVLYNFKTENPNEVIKFVAYLDNVTKENDKAALQ